MPTKNIFHLLCLAVLVVECIFARGAVGGDGRSLAQGGRAFSDGAQRAPWASIGRRLHQGNASCEASTLAGYECMVTPSGLESMTIHYLVGPVAGDDRVPTLSEDQIWFAVQAVTPGWVGIGLTENPGRMTPSDCVVGWIDGDTPVVKAYRVPVKNISPSDEDTSIEIGDVSASEVDGITTIAFTWNLASGNVPVDISSGAIDMIGAFGGADALVQHGRDERRGFAIDFLSSRAGDETSPPADDDVNVDTGATASGETPPSADADFSADAEANAVDSDSVPAASGSCPASELPGYTCVIPVPGLDRIRVHYTPGPTVGNSAGPALSADQISFAVEGDTAGWVGIGFAESAGLMAPSDCVVGWVEDGVPVVKPYRVTSRNISPGDEDVSIEITDVSASEVDGTTTIAFTWNVSSGNVPVDLASGTSAMNAALGGSDGLVQHGFDERASFTLAGVGLNQDLSRYYKAHGSLMIIAWLVCIPTGILCAHHKWVLMRFRKKGLWFQIHRGIQTVGVLLTLAALGIAVNKLDCCRTKDGDLHKPLGITVIVMALVNVILGVFRPGTAATRRWMFNYAHYFFGYGSLILAIPTVFLGIHAYDNLTTEGVSTWIAFAIVGLVLHVGLHVALETVRRVTGSEAVDEKRHPSHSQLNLVHLSQLPPEQANKERTSQTP